MNHKNDDLEITKTSKGANSIIGSQQQNPDKNNFEEQGTINVKPFLDKSDGGTLNNYSNSIPSFFAIFVILLSMTLVIYKLQEIRAFFYQLSESEQANTEKKQDDAVSQKNTQVINSQAKQEQLPDKNKTEAETKKSDKELFKTDNKINQDDAVSQNNTQVINSQAKQEQLLDKNKKLDNKFLKKDIN